MTMEERLKQYKYLQSLTLTSPEFLISCDKLTQELNEDSNQLSEMIGDLISDQSSLRRGSCYLIGRLLDQSLEAKLNLSCSQRADVINSMVLSLSNVTENQEAGQLLWALKRDALVTREEMTPYVVTILHACQRAATDIKSALANRPSYAVAAGALQLIARLYTAQGQVMKCNTKIWFSLTLSYCSHGVSKLLRGYSQDIIELSYEHLVKQAAVIRSIVSDVSENIIANITNILDKQYDEPSKLFAIKLWGLLAIIMGRDIEIIHTTNLYLSALSKAFSKNYPARQAEAFNAWKLLINNLSFEYLLQPRVRKPLTVPLTKSNRVEDPHSLATRFDCWWALVRRLGATIRDHFTEICKPLLEFCLAESAGSASNSGPIGSSGLKSRNLISKASAKNSGNRPLIKHCVAVTLLFLGQHDAKFIENVQLGEEQKDVKLTVSIMRHCGRVLLQAVDESLKYLRSTKQEDTLKSLLKAFSLLVHYVVAVSMDTHTDSELVRDLVKLVFSIVLRHKVCSAADYTLDLVAPVVEFSETVFSSTVFTPSEINSFSKNPAVCMLEVLWECWQTAAVSGSDISRFQNCVCELVEKGHHSLWSTSLTLTYIGNVIEMVPAASEADETKTGVLLQFLTCIAKVIHQSLAKVTESCEIHSFIPIYQSLVSKPPSSAVQPLLQSIAGDLLKIFRLDNVNKVMVSDLWVATSDRLQGLSSTLSPEFQEQFLPVLFCTLRHPNPSVSKATGSLWDNCLCRCANGQITNEFRIAVEEKYGKKVAAGRVTGLPPSGNPTNSPMSRKAVTPRSARKRLITSPSRRSPLKNVNKRQLVLPGQNVSASPKVITASPKVITTSPKVIASSSKVITASPKVTATSPKVTTTSPKVTTTTPKRRKKLIEEKVVSSKTDSYDLLNGLITPEKRQEFTEKTPEKGTESTLSLLTSADEELKVDHNLTTTSRTKSSDKCCPTTVTQAPHMGGEEELATLSGQSSQTIENSPASSQNISQCEDSLTQPLSSSQEISEETAAYATKKLANQLTDAVNATPKQPMRSKFSAVTPGYPITSPMAESPVSEHLSQYPPPTPMVCAVSSSQPTVELTPCSVKLMKHHLLPLSADQTILIDSLFSQSDELSQSTLVESQNGDSTADSQKRRSGRRSKAVKRLISDNSSQDSSQQSSQSQQNSQASSKKSRKKVIVNDEAVRASPVLDYIFKTSRKSYAKMILNTTVNLVQCSKVRVIKSLRSRTNRMREGDLCESQDSLCESQDILETDVQDDLPSQRESSIDVPQTVEKIAAALVTLNKNDCPSTVDSFFDLEEVVSTPRELILGSAAMNGSSLQFDTLSGSSRLSSSADSSTLTPLPASISSEADDIFSSKSAADAVSSHSSGVITNIELNSDQQDSDSIEQADDENLIVCLSNKSYGKGKSPMKVHDLSTENQQPQTESPVKLSSESAISVTLPALPVVGTLSNSQSHSVDQKLAGKKGSSDLTGNVDAKKMYEVLIALDDSDEVCQSDKDLSTDVSMASLSAIDTRLSEKVMAEDIASENVITEKVLAEKVITEKVRTEKVITEKVMVENALTEKAVTITDLDEDISLSQFDEEMEILQDSGTAVAKSVENVSNISDYVPSTVLSESDEELNIANSPSKHTILFKDDPTSCPFIESTSSSNDQVLIVDDNVDNTVDKATEGTIPTETTTAVEETALSAIPSLLATSNGSPSRTSSNSALNTPLSTPLRVPADVNRSKTNNVPSPSRAHMLMLSSRSSQILAKSKSSKNGQSSSNGTSSNMSHVDTLPATPKSRKLNVEALELDCTPIYSPTTGSILKRKTPRSPGDGSTSKKVKFQLPSDLKEGSGSGKKLKSRTKLNKEDALLAMYSSNGTTSSVESPNSAATQIVSAGCSESQASSQGLSGEPPIASEYTESAIPICDMVRHLTTPVWQGNLGQCLASQGISTVGDMAKLTEADINLLPVKQPKLSTTLKAFKKSGATKNQHKISNGLDSPSSKVFSPSKNSTLSNIAPATITAHSTSSSKAPADHMSNKQLDVIMKMVANQELTDSQLGSQIRSIFASENSSLSSSTL